MPPRRSPEESKAMISLDESRRRHRQSGLLALLLVVVAGFLLLVPSANAQQTERSKSLGQKLMCVCGCNRILTSCNHVGCKYSHDMLKELDQRVARGDSDDLILQSFVQEYGPTVLSEPPTKGFNWAAWVVPIVAPFIAIFALWEMVRRWRQRAALVPAGGVDISPEMLARARSEAGRQSDE